MATVVVVREGRMGFKLGDEVEVPDGATFPADFRLKEDVEADKARENGEDKPKDVVVKTPETAPSLPAAKDAASDTKSEIEHVEAELREVEAQEGK